MARSESTRAPRGSWKRRARVWLGASLDPALRERFEHETNEANRRRLTVLLPLMIAAHALHIALFGTWGARRAALAPSVLEWRDGIALTHFVTLVLAAVFLVIARSRRAKPSPLLGPTVATLYLLHAAVIAGVDQLAVASVTPFVGYALGAAVVVALEPAAAVVVYAVGLAAFFLAMLLMQPSFTVRLAMLPNGVSSSVVGLSLVWILDRSRRRDFAQRAIIDEQRATMAHLNISLEQRLKEKVSEIVTRAEEVERLNAQLQAQVRERSTELSLALGRLARQRDAGGVLRPGVVLGDRFEIEDRLGEGGMGTVYAGVDRSTRERVAIKVIQASSARELDALHRFLREAASTAAVNHPAVVRVLHVDVSGDGLLFQVQELVDGETLAARLENQPWEPGIVARTVSVLCEALAAAHAGGVVHRDVKPSNVMLTRAAPGLKLLDFGIAKLYEDSAIGEVGTRSGTVLGTPAFMAPEQVDGSPDVSDRADVYAVGVLLFLLLAGRHPFEHDSARRVIMSHLFDTPPDVRTVRPSIPLSMSELVARCLKKEPAERPSAGELARELRAFADGAGVASLDELERTTALHSIEAQSSRLPTTKVARKRVAE